MPEENGATTEPVVENKEPSKEAPKPVEGDETPSGTKLPEKKEEAPTKQPEVKEEVSKKDTSEWTQYEDAALIGIQDVLKDGGVTQEESAAMFAAVSESGKLEDINEKALIEKIGASKAALVMAGAKDYYNRNMAKTQETVKAVHEIFGGEQNYAVVKEWAQRKEQSDPDFQSKLNEFRVMFDQGGFSATAAAKELSNMYNNDDGTSSPEVKMEIGDAGANSKNTDPLTRNNYLEEIDKAYKGKNKHAVASLQARRRATMKQEQAEA